MHGMSRWSGGKKIRLALSTTVALAMLGVVIPAHGAGAVTGDPDFSIAPGSDPPAVTATSEYGAVVTYTAPVATDEGHSVPVSCNPPSGSTFPVGSTPVTCSATDPDGETTTPAQTTFYVTVTPAATPDSDLVITPGQNPAPVAATGPSGAQVTFATPTATDDGVSVPVSCNPPSGSTFGVGATVVTCTANDQDGDSSVPAVTTLTVTVTDTDLMISAGQNPPPAAATSSSGAHVTFTVPTATDDDGPVTVECDPNSGSLFPVGTTLVTCTATGDDQNSPQQTTLSVTVNPFVPAQPTAPSPPQNVSVTPGDGSASVAFAPPASDGGSGVSGYNATCTSSTGGNTGSAPGQSPISVAGLTNGSTYNCFVTATNGVGTSDPSPASNTFIPAISVFCTNLEACHAQQPIVGSGNAPSQIASVTGTPSDAFGSVQLDIERGSLNCPQLAPTIAPITHLEDTGFSASTRLTIVTTLRFTRATAQEQVCYSSTIPFLSQSSPLVPKSGTAFLLLCSQTASVAPCVISSKQVGNNIVVRYVVPGGDPRFYVVLPKGRQVWLSRFAIGKVGTHYSAQLQSSGGKAPVSWKVGSGKLPAGLTLNAKTGAITGTPTARGSFNIVVIATDSESPPQTSQMSVPITVK